MNALQRPSIQLPDPIAFAASLYLLKFQSSLSDSALPPGQEKASIYAYAVQYAQQWQQTRHSPRCHYKVYLQNDNVLTKSGAHPIPSILQKNPDLSLRMRLFLLPVSTRRSLIYCEKLPADTTTKRSIFDRITLKASETWVAWEKDEKAPLDWKKKVTYYGNHALNRIPYEEWGLKTIPALTAKRRKAIEDGTEKYHVVFPGRYMQPDSVTALLKKLANERQAMHTSKMIWSIVAMPFSIPFMLVPLYALSFSLL